MRLFVALELPDSVRQSLHGLAAPLESLGVPRRRFVRTDNLHLTLKFIGELPEPDVAGVCDALGRVSRLGAFGLRCEGIECLPDRGPVRIVSVGLAGDVGRLCDVQGEIESACETVGIRREARRFRPHVTIARLRQPLAPAARRRFEHFKFPRDPFEVAQFVLMQSHLEPQGARYVPLARFPL
jgi:2'-5' RNA ligase